ncbi:low temperature requirement protein A [Demequina sp. NBRC 110053]|uniref:low temperature requirement protein A n=1 Tax=Demequina sp. NBRC 110053 TaxID=1570342 RepID=UPI000A039602|nr:low temperature requirement protein A [Demequina sp. NBRC 110053]
MSPRRWSLTAHITDEDHRVTTMELLFDVVYVYAFIQVTSWIASEHSWRAVAEGLVVLAVLWWVWIAWTWLGNVMRADRGLPLAGFIIAMVAVFGIALTIRGIWEADGGSFAPMAFAAFYVVIRVVHGAVYLWGAREDRKLRRQIMLTTAAWLPAALLLFVGALLPPDQRLWWWAGTVALDVVATWILSVRGPGWRVQSGSHFAERFDLLVILALGESVLAVGIAAAKIDPTPELVALGLLGVLVAVALWWPYFKDVGPSLEEALEEAEPRRKADIARDSYTYLHLPLLMGIILVAAGNEEAVIALENEEASEAAALLISAGAALFAATAAVLMRLAGATWHWLAGSAAFFALGTLWLPLLDPTVAVAAAVVVLAFVGWLTPATRHREPVAVEADAHGEGAA